jgi:parallel beta-helix repeat protein
LVLVSNGVYAVGATAVYGMSNRVAVIKAVTVQSVNGPTVTTIYGYKELGTNYGPSAVRCAYLTNGAVLSGFTLTNGATQSSGDTDKNRSGGGVWCESTRAVVTNCMLTGNLAPNNGGGIYCGTLGNCTLTGNDTKGQGAAYRSALNNCTLMGNVAGTGGGASASTLNNCILTNNSSSRGGGTYSCTLSNCTLNGNYSGYNPGGGASFCTLNNCTLIGNSANFEGGGAASSTLNNCALIGNWTGNGGGAV